MGAQRALLNALRPSILAERAGWIAINKPPMWHSVAPGLRRLEKDPAAGGESSVEKWLRETRPELEGVQDAGLVQRLDFGTSGCMLAAKDTAGRAALQVHSFPFSVSFLVFRKEGTREVAQWCSADAIRRMWSLHTVRPPCLRPWGSLQDKIKSQNAIRKTYLVLVEGEVASEGDFEFWFAKRYRGSSKISVSPRHSPNARLGSCTWSRIHRTVLETDEGMIVPVSALEVRPPSSPLPPPCIPQGDDRISHQADMQAPRSDAGTVSDEARVVPRLSSRPALRGRCSCSVPGAGTRSARDSRT